MRINAKLAVGDLVVFNHSLDAAMFRVVEIDIEFRNRIGVVVVAVNYPTVQYLDKCYLLTPSPGQIKKQHTARTNA